MPSIERAKLELLELIEHGAGTLRGSEERDFLRSNARTPFSEDFQAVGLRLRISTNFDPILSIARSCFCGSAPSESGHVPVHFRIWADPSGRTPSPLAKPYFRGLDHLAFIGLDSQSSFLLDLRTRKALGRVTPDIASNDLLWKSVIFPVLLTTFAGAAGRPAIHAGCVAREGRGVLLAGDSGSGKSTLSLALAQAGLGFVSDDRTILFPDEGRLLAAGISPCLKLRPEALIHFGAVGVNSDCASFNQADAVYLSPEYEFGVERLGHCEPQMIFWLEQQATPGFSIEGAPSCEIVSRLASGLTKESPEATQAQRSVFESLSERECFIVKYGGNPHGTARAIREFLIAKFDGAPTIRKKSREAVTHLNRSRDPLRRFTATPLSADYRLMRRHIRVETNCTLVLEHTRQTFDCYPQATATLPDFVWRIIADPQSPLIPPWPEMSAFSDHARRYINLGQKSFIAVDLDCREAVAFVSEGLVKHQDGFASIVLASMFYLCAGALGLTAISSACVADDGKGLLLFGVPRSGKTTSCFIARRHGYEFHADQAVFLEMQEGIPRAWGDFWPAAFHEESSAFMPEISRLGRPFVHQAASYFCAEKELSPNGIATSVVPVACIFLERAAADPPKLIPLNELDLANLLDRFVPFQDHSGVEETRRAVIQALLKLPAYRLQYDDQPSTSASFFRSLLSTYQVVGSLR